MAASTITIVVRPAPRPQTRRAAGALLFDAFVEGKWLCRSKQPFLDGCRKLLQRGVDPATIVQMQHENTGTASLRGALRAGARFTVSEGDGSIQFRKWMPHAARGQSDAAKQATKEHGNATQEAGRPSDTR